MSKRHALIFISLTLMLIGIFLASLTLGAGSLKIGQVISHIIHPGISSMEGDIIWKLRLPRIILALLVGAGLAVSGAVLQGMLRNPLAEPYTIGISGASAFGVSLGIVLGVGTSLLPVFSAGAAIITMSLVYIIACRKRFSASSIILGGVILSFFFSSCVRLIFSLAKTEKVHSAILWLMGDLSCADPILIKIISFIILGAIALLTIFSRDINILTLGEEKATYLGINIEFLNKLLFITCSIIIGAAVAASGIISFVGLIIPHLMRYLGGADYRFLIPASALAGAIFLTLCDTLARTVILPLEFPVGVITGIIGGVFFLIYLFLSKTKKVF
ncbi:MAG: iron ABC transporter permease [Candidatus Omnitrophota bacterium]|nr:MAG: iron ABC transporter permease [Candidatus Omnitrophota bacterium]